MAEMHKRMSDSDMRPLQRKRTVSFYDGIRPAGPSTGPAGGAAAVARRGSEVGSEVDEDGGRQRRRVKRSASILKKKSCLFTLPPSAGGPEAAAAAAAAAATASSPTAASASSSSPPHASGPPAGVAHNSCSTSPPDTPATSPTLVRPAAQHPPRHYHHHRPQSLISKRDAFAAHEAATAASGDGHADTPLRRVDSVTLLPPDQRPLPLARTPTLTLGSPSPGKQGLLRKYSLGRSRYFKRRNWKDRWVHVEADERGAAVLRYYRDVRAPLTDAQALALQPLHTIMLGNDKSKSCAVCARLRGGGRRGAASGGGGGGGGDGDGGAEADAFSQCTFILPTIDPALHPAANRKRFGNVFFGIVFFAEDSSPSPSPPRSPVEGAGSPSSSPGSRGSPPPPPRGRRGSLRQRSPDRAGSPTPDEAARHRLGMLNSDSSTDEDGGGSPDLLCRKKFTLILRAETEDERRDWVSFLHCFCSVQPGYGCGAEQDAELAYLGGKVEAAGSGGCRGVAPMTLAARAASSSLGNSSNISSHGLTLSSFSTNNTMANTPATSLPLHSSSLPLHSSSLQDIDAHIHQHQPMIRTNSGKQVRFNQSNNEGSGDARPAERDPITSTPAGRHPAYYKVTSSTPSSSSHGVPFPSATHHPQHASPPQTTQQQQQQQPNYHYHPPVPRGTPLHPKPSMQQQQAGSTPFYDESPAAAAAAAFLAGEGRGSSSSEARNQSSGMTVVKGSPTLPAHYHASSLSSDRDSFSHPTLVVSPRPSNSQPVVRA